MTRSPKLIYLLLSLCLIFSLPVYADNWRLDKDSNGIKIYTRAIQGSKIREIKGEVLLESSLDSALAVFNDIPQYPHWYHKNTKAFLLQERNIAEHYHYQNIVMPFPVTDRDMIIHSKITQEGNNIRVVSRSADTFCDKSTLSVCNTIKKSKNIMVTRLQGTHLFTPQKEGGVKLVWRQHVEPAGKIPKWLVNQLLVDVPYKTLKNLKKQLKLKKYRDIKLKRDANGLILGFQ